MSRSERRSVVAVLGWLCSCWISAKEIGALEDGDRETGSAVGKTHAFPDVWRVAVRPAFALAGLMTGPKPGRAACVTVDGPGGKLCVLQDFCIAGAADAFSLSDVDSCELPGGVRACICAVSERPGEELTCRSAIPGCGGVLVLQAGEGAAARELPGEIEGGV